ncbi:NtaA/DmoA family FMN-dependent monooxygenase [Corynebacterium variabile]|uniref:FMN-dependent oxidoreductase, nitrilotriacetate monooxygenase family n=1 Tax=Corynebacterium variabile TaxID=1727 RepID=A0A0X2NPE0_9CORY|nr:FMN-dependent oxidoreductase, nitrilotriacetate monooxygenase family [Corynebacterium variabile]
MQTARSITVTAAASLTAVLGLGVLTSCGTAAGQGDDDYTGPPVNGGTLRVAFDADITCADGRQAGNNTALNVSRQITDSLTDQDPETGEIVPWLAESWDVSDDSTTFTFHLRDGVTFTDGTPFTAQPVKDNFEGIVDLGAKSSLGSTYLAAHFPGVNNTTVWADPDSGSHIEFAGFEHFARTAERGLFDFLFLAEGLRLREHKGQVFDQDVVGRPETATVLSALAAVTTHIGLTGTFNSTFNEPYDLARTLATLDRVSGGRAAWNVVTSHNAFTGANFRRGGYLDGADRYRRAADFVSLARTLWESHRGSDGSFDWHSDFFDVHGTFPVPETPQISPVIFQAGDSDEGRDFAARHAEVIFSAHTEAEDRKAFRTDIDQRLAAVGRRPDSLKIYPGISVILGDTEAEAQERYREVRRAQVHGPGAIAFLEQVWGRDLSGYDPDGPLPDVGPDLDNADITRGRVRHEKDYGAVARRWRALAEEKNLSIRELVTEVSGRGGTLIGTPAQVVAKFDDLTQQRDVDGFIVVPHITPGGLDEIVDRVVPELQDRGVYRTSYAGSTTLRDNLDLPAYNHSTSQEVSA